MFALAIASSAGLATRAAPPVDTRPVVHDHEVRAAMVAQTGGGLASLDNRAQGKALPVLPDAFDSFGHFEFIETIESADGGVTSSGSDSASERGGGAANDNAGKTSRSKPIPKKLKCSCSFAKLDSPQPSLFLQAMEKRLNSHSMLRSAQ